MSLSEAANRSNRISRPWAGPGWWLLAAFGLLLLVGISAVTVPVWRQQAIENQIERLGGQVVSRPGGPDWLRTVVPEDAMRPFDQIVRVDFYGSPLTDSDVSNLAPALQQFDRLRELDLAGTAISDAGLEPIEDLQQLKLLSLSETAITDAGLSSVARLSQLTSLNLDHTQVTDDGIRSLSRLKHLNELSVANTGVTDFGIAGLQGRLPELMTFDD